MYQQLAQLFESTAFTLQHQATVMNIILLLMPRLSQANRYKAEPNVGLPHM